VLTSNCITNQPTNKHHIDDQAASIGQWADIGPLGRRRHVEQQLEQLNARAKEWANALTSEVRLYIVVCSLVVDLFYDSTTNIWQNITRFSIEWGQLCTLVRLFSRVSVHPINVNLWPINFTPLDAFAVLFNQFHEY